MTSTNRVTWYFLVVLILSFPVGLWTWKEPAATLATQNQVFSLALLALLGEITAARLPFFGFSSVSMAPYAALLFLFGPASATTAALFSILARSLLLDRSPWLLRAFPLPQAVLVFGFSGLFSHFFQQIFHLSPDHPLPLLLTCALLFVLEFVTTATAVGLSLDEDKQRTWYQRRYRIVPLSITLPFLGLLIAHLYKGNPAYLIPVLLIAGLIQLAAKTMVKSEEEERVTLTMLEEIERLREENSSLEKKAEGSRAQVARKQFELGVLLDFGQALGTDLSLDNASEVILKMIGKLFPTFQTCIIFFAEARGEESFLVAKRYTSPYKDYCKTLHIKFGETIVGKCALEGEPLIMDGRKPVKFGPLLEYERSEMAVPLIVEKRVRGVLYVGHKGDLAFKGDDLALLSTLASEAAIVLVYADSYERTVGLATTDGLTGLHTHRHFQERLTEEVRRSDRYRQPLALLMIDVDQFKEFNDSLGHPQGDQLLREVSQIIRSYTRETDVVCRYGGDEFAILLIETNKENASQIAERMRQAFELRLNKEGRVKITGSFGVASFPEDANNRSDLLARADAALYLAKRGGRNRVITAHADIEQELSAAASQPLPMRDIFKVRKKPQTPE